MLLNTLNYHLSKPTKLGLELLALPAIIAYPNMYKLGKKSIYMTCSICGKQPQDHIDAQFMIDSSICLGCDHVLGERENYEETTF